MDPVNVLIWIGIVVFGVGLILFVIGLFLPRVTVAGPFDWTDWLKEQFTKAWKIVFNKNSSMGDRVNAAGILLMIFGLIIILIAVGIGLAIGTFTAPAPTPTPTAT